MFYQFILKYLYYKICDIRNASLCKVTSEMSIFYFYKNGILLVNNKKTFLLYILIKD